MVDLSLDSLVDTASAKQKSPHEVGSLRALAFQDRIKQRALPGAKFCMELALALCVFEGGCRCWVKGRVGRYRRQGVVPPRDPKTMAGVLDELSSDDLFFGLLVASNRMVSPNAHHA